MDLSIVICSYDRYDLLGQAIAAVANSESFEPDRMQLVVVDNTPRRRRRKLGMDRKAEIVVCEEAGLSNARNAGIAASKGRIIAFIDDDAIVHQDWCRAVLNAFEQFPNAAVCGGRTLPLYSSRPRPRWYYDDLSRYLSCIDWGPSDQPLKPGQWIVGANMAFRREVFEKFGLFDPALGRKGTASLLSNEEIALLSKVGRDKVYFVPDMVVDHVIPDERVSLDWFRKRVFWQAVSDVLAGETFKGAAQAARELQGLVAEAPAEIRGYRLLSYEPDTAAAFRKQLSAIYMSTVLMAAGFPDDAMEN